MNAATAALEGETAAASTAMKAMLCVKGLIAWPLGETLVERKLKVGCEGSRQETSHP
jgi:uncharacterized protein (DUF169 family)